MSKPDQRRFIISSDGRELAIIRERDPTGNSKTFKVEIFGLFDGSFAQIHAGAVDIDQSCNPDEEYFTKICSNRWLISIGGSLLRLRGGDNGGVVQAIDFPGKDQAWHYPRVSSCGQYFVICCRGRQPEAEPEPESSDSDPEVRMGSFADITRMLDLDSESDTTQDSVSLSESQLDWDPSMSDLELYYRCLKYQRQEDRERGSTAREGREKEATDIRVYRISHNDKTAVFHSDVHLPVIKVIKFHPKQPVLGIVVFGLGEGGDLVGPDRTQAKSTRVYLYDIQTATSTLLRTDHTVKPGYRRIDPSSLGNYTARPLCFLS